MCPNSSHCIRHMHIATFETGLGPTFLLLTSAEKPESVLCKLDNSQGGTGSTCKMQNLEKEDPDRWYIEKYPLLTK